MKQIISILLTVVFLLNGCGSSAPRVVVAQKTLPTWYMHPPHSNENILYAVGDGKEKQEAINNALTTILATLSVSISSKYSAKTVIKEGTHHNSSDATYVNETQSKIEKIKVSNYEVIEAEQLGFKHYAVLVQLNKAKFFQALHKELTQKFTSIDAQAKTLKGTNALEKLSFYKKALDALENMPNTLAVMSVLNPAFDERDFVRRYNKIQQQYKALLQKITFWIKANYKPLASPIAKGLSKEKLMIKKVNNSSHFTVFIDATIQKAQAYGFSIARAELTIKTKDSRGNIIATNALNLVGQSSQGYSIAKQDLVKKLTKLVSTEGIAKVLNLDI